MHTDRNSEQTLDDLEASNGRRRFLARLSQAALAVGLASSLAACSGDDEDDDDDGDDDD